MGGGIKSHQDTVVHPMYVSYNSLPTSGGTLLRHNQSLFRQKRQVTTPMTTTTTAGIDCHKNFVNFNGRDNLLRSAEDPKSCNLKTSTEGALNDMPNYFPPTPLGVQSHSVMTGPRNLHRRFLAGPEEMVHWKANQRKSMVEGDVSFYTSSEPVDDLIDLHPANMLQQIAARPPCNSQKNMSNGDIEEEEDLPEYNTFNRANILVNQRLKNGGFYKMPADFIPRSPNLSASGYRRRNQNVLKNMNFCDQIRSPVATQIPRDHYGGMGQPVRTRSHTQLPIKSESSSINNRYADSASAGRGELPLPINCSTTIEEDDEARRRNDDWSANAGGFVAVDGDIQQKMNQMLRKKKSLRPRSYCSSNYYHEFEQVAGVPQSYVVQSPN